MFDAGKSRRTGLPYGGKNYDDMLSRFHRFQGVLRTVGGDVPAPWPNPEPSLAFGCLARYSLWGIPCPFWGLPHRTTSRFVVCANC